MSTNESTNTEQMAANLLISIIADTHPDLIELHADLTDLIENLDTTARVTGINEVDGIIDHLQHYLFELQKKVHEQYDRHIDH